MTISVTLPSELEERLSALAKKTGHGREEQLAAIIARGLEDMEDYYSAHDVLDRIAQDKEKVLTSKEMWRGLDD